MKKNGNAKRTGPKRISKYDKPIHIDATPEEIAKTIFAGKPKPEGQWDYLKRDKQGS